MRFSRTTTRSILIAAVTFLLVGIVWSASRFGLLASTPKPDEFSLESRIFTSGTAIPSQLGGLAMTDVIVPANSGNSIASLTSPTLTGGQLTFLNRDGTAVNLQHQFASTLDWWVNGEPIDYSVLTASAPFLRIQLPENTRAIAFNFGSDTPTTLSIGTSTPEGKEYKKDNIVLLPGITEGIAEYDNDKDDECSYLTEITLETTDMLGLGNISINQDKCSTLTSVPESQSLYLFGLGLLLLLLRAIKRG